MNKLSSITLALLAAAVISGCGKSGAYKAYLAYCAATKAGDCPALNALVVEGSPAKAWVEGFCGAPAGMTIMGQNVGGPSAAAMAAELNLTPAGAMMKLRHRLESEDKAADGTVKLVAVESVPPRPGGLSRPAPPRTHTVTLKKVGEAWKIVEFVQQDR